ncbi:RagB/SusD family nutrient uptake outer membrane protein [Bacteroides salyersiae]|jgi:tetratricopeptide (TPR) repeat protein|uniref:RagB/SusD family nutrient uptake outer membrane protein n=1 Tax=Bacteroides salyersiae TaxID=291644 RepID=UPI001C8C8B02|nr:RagB/SusD family nutrient uptake outer membrane protein [Bacteroides salyersiae]
MKTKKYILCIAMTALLGGTLTSCEDWFNIHPKSETIFDDFWKDESDVLSMVGSCYRGMNETGFIERLIVWSEVRSDNVKAGPGVSDPIKDMLNINLNSSNTYTYWGEYYSVINYCNTVIKFAPEVESKDPNFKRENLDIYIAEAKGVRALCYFILLRTFRDIPLITEPYADDSLPFEVAQEDPDKLLDFLIDDLKSVENQAADEKTWNNLIYSKGRITKNAIRALIADMYLWKNEYSNCITYCDKVLSNLGQLQLEGSRTYNSVVFFRGNSKESIFELQFDQNNIPNYAVNEMYGLSGGRGDKNPHQLMPYNFEAMADPLFKATDLRGKDAFFNSSSKSFIAKYTALRGETSSGTVRESDYLTNTESANWIFYRLSDIYLMKAEALVEIGADLEGALDLVSKTYDRANPDLGSGSLQMSDYNSQDKMRNLVFDERQKEFVFEGKRYFDLLRRIRREPKQNPTNVVNAYLLKKYDKLDNTTTKSKLSEINAFYMPINADELRANGALKQNPFYVTSTNIE